MQQAHHDTSTQAMTEVALGLSMAFFSLLILALFSIGLPEQAEKSKPVQKQQSLSAEQQLKLAPRNTGTSTKKASKNNQQYAFYFNGQFYDKNLKRLSIENLAAFEVTRPLILAVPDNLPLLQVMALRKQINHPNLSITMLNQKWQMQLEKVQ